MKQEGVPYWLYIKLVKKNSYYNPELRDKKGNKENQRNYKWLFIHSCNCSLMEFFALCIARANSFLRMLRPPCTEGDSCRKMKSLRDIQMPQHPRIITSIKNGILSCRLKEATTSMWSWNIGTVSSKDAENWVTKGQTRNRCSRVFLEFWLQRTQSCDWRIIPFLSNRSLVLNRSFRSSQKKTLCLCWQQFFQSHL